MFSIPEYPDLVIRFNDCSSFERFGQAFNIRCLTNGILESETYAKRRLPQAIATLEDTLPLISLITRERGIATEVREALAADTRIDFGD
ncbi:MAG TPA: hypothetical protein VLG16_00965 [Candidatus Saccharimonadales bacterium]|nr:hypothetical protein [Candidatus Saccharimonadales bacterium]